jgi:hypothetical protein
MNPGYIRFGIATLVILAFFLGCDGSGKKGEGAQDESMQGEGSYTAGDEDENIPTDQSQRSGDGGGA